MKFLVIWKIELSLLSGHVASAVARMPSYAKPLERSGQIAARYHIVGAHGGAWVYDVGSNEELERLIALMPVYNFAHYTVYPLAEMPDWDETGARRGRPARSVAFPAPANPARNDRCAASDPCAQTTPALEMTAALEMIIALENHCAGTIAVPGKILCPER